MDFWTSQVPETKTQTLKSKPSEPQVINFEDFQNFDNEQEEINHSEDLLQSQDLESSKNKIAADDNFLLNEDFHFPVASNQNNNNLPSPINKNIGQSQNVNKGLPLPVNQNIVQSQNMNKVFATNKMDNNKSSTYNDNILDNQNLIVEKQKGEFVKKESIKKIGDFFSGEDLLDFGFSAIPNQNIATGPNLIEKTKSDIPKKDVPNKEERKPSIKKEISKNTNNEAIFCSIHDEEGGFFYCKDCQNFNVCVQCIVKGFHKGHNVLNLKNSQFGLRQKYEECLGKLKEKNEEFGRKDKILNENIQNSRNILTQNKHLVGVYFKEIKALLEKKEKDFCAKIEQITEKNVTNIKNSGDLIRKSLVFLDENIRNLTDLANNNEFMLFKMILEGSLDSLLRNVASHDATLVNSISKIQAQDEEILNKTIGKISKVLTRVKDVIENNNDNIPEIFESRSQKTPQKQEKFELSKPAWDDFKINENHINNIEERTILVSLPKPQDNNQENNFFKMAGNFKTFNENQGKAGNENKRSIENSLQRLKNEIKSLSPPKPIFHEYLNPFASTNKEISDGRKGLKTSSFNNLLGNKGSSVKKSYIVEEANLKNSFLSKRTLLKKNNIIKDSRFHAFEEVKNSFFELDRTQRLKHFHNLNKNNIDKLTLKKDKRFML